VNTKLKLAALCYLINMLAFALIGFAFVFKQQFFGFHADVIQTSWQDLDASAQTLYLGMMRTEGAGFVASAVAFAFLLLIPFRRRETWSYWALSAIGMTEHVPTFLATLHVSNTTAASPPWLMTLVLMFLLIIGLVLSLWASPDER
jgi:hypothetical protein